MGTRIDVGTRVQWQKCRNGRLETHCGEVRDIEGTTLVVQSGDATVHISATSVIVERATVGAP